MTKFKKTIIAILIGVSLLVVAIPAIWLLLQKVDYSNNTFSSEIRLRETTSRSSSSVNSDGTNVERQSNFEEVGGIVGESDSSVNSAVINEEGQSNLGEASRFAEKASSSVDSSVVNGEKRSNAGEASGSATSTTSSSADSSTTNSEEPSNPEQAETPAEEETNSSQPQAESKPKFSNSYGVFLGMNSDQIDQIMDYQTVVVEGSEFSAKDIKRLHSNKQKVYAYLNVGAVENFRSYYSQFEDITLGVYDDWPDERWVDVSQSRWQDFLVNTLAKSYADKGFDGLFLDNFDVWYEYPEPKIYMGLLEILKGLKKHNIKIIINGGDTFVKEAIKRGEAKGLIDGVNQETVFTSIDFDNNVFGKQDDENHEYYEAYIKQCKSFGLSVYLLEYGSDEKLRKEIKDYCQRNGYEYYISSSLNLDTAD